MPRKVPGHLHFIKLTRLKTCPLRWRREVMERVRLLFAYICHVCLPRKKWWTNWFMSLRPDVSSAPRWKPAPDSDEISIDVCQFANRLVAFSSVMAEYNSFNGDSIRMIRCGCFWLNDCYIAGHDCDLAWWYMELSARWHIISQGLELTHVTRLQLKLSIEFQRW